MLKLDHKVVIGYTTINVIGVTTVFVKYPPKRSVIEVLKQYSNYTKIKEMQKHITVSFSA